MKQVVLKVDNVSMRFNLMEKKVDNLKEYIIKLVKNELRYQEFWALQNISFSIDKGDRLGILGLNGAGKSTLLKIIAGVMKATQGSISIKGKIVPLLELGAGFDPQYTGMENIFLYGAVLGYPKDFIKSKFDEIVEFAELGDFIHVPVKNYSSGMKARLGFSIATVMEPDILILDEVLSVGDAKFRKKSEKRIQEMFDRGITVLFVSHSIEQVKRICNKAIILDKGKLIAEGDAEDVCKIYNKMVGETDKSSAKKKAKKKKKKKKPVSEVAENVSETPKISSEESKKDLVSELSSEETNKDMESTTSSEEPNKDLVSELSSEEPKKDMASETSSEEPNKDLVSELSSEEPYKDIETETSSDVSAQL